MAYCETSRSGTSLGHCRLAATLMVFAIAAAAAAPAARDKAFLAPTSSPAVPLADQAHAAGLVFAHVPCNFGHSIERSSLGNHSDLALLKKAWHTAPSSFLPIDADGQTVKDAWRAWAASANVSEAISFVEQAKVPGALPKGHLWGMTDPPTWVISNVTGCNLYYTPGKWWPSDLAGQYFANASIFGVLRDPYDKAANEFRRQAQGIDSAFNWQTRHSIDAREGDKERDGERYRRYFETCDVNAYLKEELTKFKAGDRFRGNCALLPQADYFDSPFGITVPVDNRKFPDSFKELMVKHNYSFHINVPVHNWDCNDVSAYSLNAEVKQLIKDVYERDFELLCSYFGYCDRDAITCMEHIPHMCGGKPHEQPANDIAGKAR